MFRFLIYLLISTTVLFSKDSEFNTGLKPDSFELVRTLPEANPRYIKHRGLPSSVDLSQYMPPVGSQGKQGSCVGWSTAYANKSFLEFIERKDKIDWKYNNSAGSPDYSRIFSPAFIYNQINGGKDNGSSIFDAMTLMVSKGAVPWSEFPYDQNNFKKQPNASILATASKFKSKEFKRVRYNDTNEVKSLLAQGRPVVVGVLIDTTFYDLKGKSIYKSAPGKALGGHAITLVGYDDSRKALKFINSWGTYWGDEGYGYIDYNFFKKICRSAYVMYDIVEDHSPQVVVNDTPIETDNPPENVVDTDKKILPPDEINASKGLHPDKIILTWSKVPNAIGYEIYRSLTDEDDFQLIGLSHNTYFEDDGILADTAYSYKLTSVTEYNVSVKSEGEVIGYATNTSTTPPTKVSGLTATDGTYPDRILLDWSDQDNTTGYYIYRWDPRSFQYKQIGSSTESQFEDKSAKSGGVHQFYTVIAYNKQGYGEFSNAATGRTSLPQKPAAPTNLTASLGEFKNQIKLHWDRAKGANSYLVLRYERYKWESIGMTNSPTFIDKNPSTGLKFYTVIGKNSQNQWGTYSNYAKGFIDPNLARGSSKLPPPTDLKAAFDPKSGEIHLTWSKVKGADDYNIWYKKSGGTWKFLESVNAKLSDFKTKIPDSNSFYLYAVTSKKTMGGDSDYSQPVSVVDSTAKKAKKSRSFTSTSKLERIAGVWTALQWDGETGVKNVVMEIEPLDDENVQVKINNKKVYQTKYINQSPELNFDGKVKIKIHVDDSLLVEVKDKAITKDSTELSFLRE
ncbi:MAG: cysteine protease [Leptospiraceae bacterium]|nr:cysteine protease [Leptospiraceae bacterium]MCP5510926.1 cysteine protease [Leptospiraceae bacterium]